MTIFQWLCEFKNAQQIFEEMGQSGHPWTSSLIKNVGKVKDLSDSDHCLCRRIIAEVL